MRTWLLASLLLLSAPVVADATMLQVTGGRVVTDEQDFDLFATLTGQDFTVTGSHVVGSPFQPWSLTTGQSMMVLGVVTPEDFTLRLTMTYAPLPAPVRGSPAIVEAFSMLGTWRHDDATVDLFGQGLLTVSWPIPPLSSFGQLRVEFAFTPTPVPEPASLILAGLALAAVVVMKREWT